jgi:hypothetical protein
LAFLLRRGEENGRLGRADGTDLAPSEADGLEDIVHLQRVDSRMQLLDLGKHSVELRFVRRMREAVVEARSITMVDSETDGAAVVESIEDSAVGKVGGEATLLEHLAREGSENVMEGFVEEHCLGDEAMRR